MFEDEKITRADRAPVGFDGGAAGLDGATARHSRHAFNIFHTFGLEDPFLGSPVSQMFGGPSPEELADQNRDGMVDAAQTAAGGMNQTGGSTGGGSNQGGGAVLFGMDATTLAIVGGVAVLGGVLLLRK